MKRARKKFLPNLMHFNVFIARATFSWISIAIKLKPTSQLSILWSLWNRNIQPVQWSEYPFPVCHVAMWLVLWTAWLKLCIVNPVTYPLLAKVYLQTTVSFRPFIGRNKLANVCLNSFFYMTPISPVNWWCGPRYWIH